MDDMLVVTLGFGFGIVAVISFVCGYMISVQRFRCILGRKTKILVLDWGNMFSAEICGPVATVDGIVHAPTPREAVARLLEAYPEQVGVQITMPDPSRYVHDAMNKVY